MIETSKEVRHVAAWLDFDTVDAGANFGGSAAS